MDQERVESMCTPSNLHVVTLSTVCDAILGRGKLVLARRPSRPTISLVLEVIFAQVSKSAKQVRMWISSCRYRQIVLCVKISQ